MPYWDIVTTTHTVASMRPGLLPRRYLPPAWLQRRSTSPCFNEAGAFAPEIFDAA